MQNRQLSSEKNIICNNLCDDNFINILRAPFLCKSVLCSNSLYFVLLSAKGNWQKSSTKMLLKLTAGLIKEVICKFLAKNTSNERKIE